jgi:O-antigen/teichoic acid export membrane protein
LWTKDSGINIYPKFHRFLSLIRLRPFETSTEAGRSKERVRRAAMTTVSAGGARALGMLASLVTVPLTFRYLGPERYGLWMVLVSIISAMTFADLGIGNGLVNAVSEAYGKDDNALAREYITSAFVLLLGIASILAVAAAIAWPFIPWMRLFNVHSAAVAAEGSRAFLVLYAWFVISIPIGVVTRAQAGLQQGYVSQIVTGFGSFATLLALLAVIRLHGSLAWLVLGSTFGTIAATFVNGGILFRQHPWLIPAWHAYRTSSATKILRLGLMFFILQCAFTVGYTSDNIVITQIMGVSAVAAYAVPQKLFGFVSLVVGMALTPLWPAYGEAISRGDVAWVRKAFRGSIWLTLAITVPSCSILALAGPWILRVFFGKALRAPMSLLIILGMWGVIAAISVATSILLNGAGVLKAQAIVAVVASSANLILSIWFTRRIGVAGVCLGSIITQVSITLPVCFVLIRRLFGNLSRMKTTDNLNNAHVGLAVD